jgi:galactokinase/mevalonate kinase-like predicted kinase
MTDLGLKTVKIFADGADLEAILELAGRPDIAGFTTNPTLMRQSGVTDYDSGALGGKLVGAGAGGFLLFYGRDQRALRQAMAAEGLAEVRFTFDHDGSTVIARD